MHGNHDSALLMKTVTTGVVLQRGLGALTPRFVSTLADRALEWLEHGEGQGVGRCGVLHVSVKVCNFRSSHACISPHTTVTASPRQT